MDRAYIEDIRHKLKKTLPKPRFYHTLGVANTAWALALRFGVDAEKAELAGLLHDGAKAYGNIELKEKMDASFVDLFGATREEIEVMKEKSPQVLHALYGVYLAHKEYGITDMEVLSAIRWHTTAKPDMTLLEKIIYIADYIEPNRSGLPYLESFRKEAFIDVEKTFVKGIIQTCAYLEKSGAYIDEMTRKCLAWYQEEK